MQAVDEGYCTDEGEIGEYEYTGITLGEVDGG